jgi:D-amino-acid dehydrogenase
MERGEVGRGASYGNAGLLVPSYSTPLANPASIGEGIRALMGRSSALVLRPRADPRFAAWLARFLVACRPSQAERAARLLHALSTASVGRYRQLMEGELGEEAGFRASGWLYVFSRDDALAGGVAQAREAARMGSRWEHLGPAEVRELEPALRDGLAGGVLFPDDCILRPDALVPALARIAAAEGVEIRTGVEVLGFVTEGDRVTAVRTPEGTLPTGAVVVACGVHTPSVLATLGARVPIEPAKGYSITFRAAAGAPSIPLNLTDAHVVVSPSGGRVRVAGGLDLTGMDERLDQERLDGIWRECRSWLPALEPAGEPERWYGFRPLPPDCLPIIGPLRRFPNVVVAAGHGTLGVTLGPVTGALVARCLDEGGVPDEVAPYLPARFGA